MRLQKKERRSAPSNPKLTALEPLTKPGPWPCSAVSASFASAACYADYEAFCQSPASAAPSLPPLVDAW